MKLCTASETIRFIGELEEQLAVFGKGIAEKYRRDQQTWLAYAKENRTYVSQVQMAYQSAITDAIEGCYAFDLETDEFALNTGLTDETSYQHAVAMVVAAEEKMIHLYQTGAEQSGALLADVPRNFKIILKKRAYRLNSIKALAI